MHAFVITGGSREKRQAWIDEKMREWHIGAFDARVLTPQDLSIGIASVREFTSHLYLIPSGTGLVGIIHEADLLTPEAQNALLKTLEEPPSRCRIILETSSINVLLPTIVSRCTIASLRSTSQFSKEQRRMWIAQWMNLTTHSVGKQIRTVDTIVRTREDAETWVLCGIEALDGQIMTMPPDAIRRLLRARVQLAANVTPKLALDTLVMSLNYSIMMST